MNNRKTKCLDKVQATIIKRMICYWACGLVFVTMVLSIINFFIAPGLWFTSHVGQVWVDHWPVFACTLVLLPFALYDITRFSNRFVGPIHRVREELKTFQNDGEMENIQFRANDFWTELSEGLNLMNQRLNELQTEKQQWHESQSQETVEV